MSKLNVNEPIDISFLGNVIWFATLALVVRYFQAVVHIERQYDYLHSLENRLNKHYGQKAFTREGEAYLSAYPIFSKWTSLLYSVVFPAFLCGVVVTKLAVDWRRSGGFTWSFIVGIIISLSILISTGLSMYWIHIKRRVETD